MSTPVAPKPENLDAAIEHLKAHPLTEELKIDVLQKIGAHLSSPEVIATLIDKVEKLSGAALAIDADFDRIGKLLTKVHADAPKDLQDAISTLAKKWEEYRKRYIDLLWDSRRLADKARVAVDDFGITILPVLKDETRTVPERKTVITDYQQDLETDEKQAATLSQNFTDLHQDIGKLNKEWQEIATKFTKQSDEQLRAIDDEIQRLTLELAGLYHKMETVLITAGVNLAAAPLLARLDPALWLIWGTWILGSTIVAELVLLKKFNADYKQLEENKAKRVKAADTVSAVMHVESDLNRSQGDVEDILVKLKAFASVWAAIRSDLQYCSDYLDFFEKSNPKALLYKLRLDAVQPIYVALGKALERYAKIVSEDHELFDGKAATSA